MAVQAGAGEGVARVRVGETPFVLALLTHPMLNQDGKTNGITAPSVNSQMELERTVYSRHTIDPETITYIETHGTGTKLGDPIELQALASVFKEKTTRNNFCALGSVKSNIGHTTAAAGIAGLQKVLLSMRHRTLVPSLHVTKENSHFDFKNSPFYISREKQAWTVAAGYPRRAAVSSFGFSGTNAHLVIEEYSAPAEPAVPPGTTPPSSCLFQRGPLSNCDKKPAIYCRFPSGRANLANLLSHHRSRVLRPSTWPPWLIRCRSAEMPWPSASASS